MDYYMPQNKPLVWNLQNIVNNAGGELHKHLLLVRPSV